MRFAKQCLWLLCWPISHLIYSAEDMEMTETKLIPTAFFAVLLLVIIVVVAVVMASYYWPGMEQQA